MAIIIIIGILIAAVAILPVVFSGYIVGVPLPPLQLPRSSAASTSVDSSSLDGTWSAASDSVAGFRVEESFILQKGTIVGRTDAVDGSLVIANQTISSASFQVDLSKVVITINQQTNNLARILDTNQYPSATFDLTTPVDISQLAPDGQTISATADGSLTMNGVTHPVTLSLSGQYDGSQLEALGSASIRVSDWNIKNPFGIHEDATIEFLIILQRQ